MPAAMDKVFIRDLTVECVIGCLTWERQIEQPLVLALEVYLDLQTAAERDELQHTVNYAEICTCAAQTLRQVKAQLLEHAAYHVIVALFEQFSMVQRITITLTKPAIIANAQAVGIVLDRSRDDICTRSGK